MLASNSRPNQHYASDWIKKPLPVYWKTGTSFGYRDAWSVGVFGPYVMAVWVGNFSGQGNMSLVGRKMAGPLFFKLVDAIRSQSSSIDGIEFFQPDSVKKVNVCSHSGQLATAHCQVTKKASFIPGVSPIKKCKVHRVIHVDSLTGLRSCEKNQQSVKKVYEFWTSDLLSIFKQAGIARRLPPPYPPSCKKKSYRAETVKPEIKSPLKKVTYIHMNNTARNQTIAFSAISDAGVRKLYWFLNESYLGATEAGIPFYWPTRVGHYYLRVIDDHGGVDTRELFVENGE